jgi:hypothetical protein
MRTRAGNDTLGVAEHAKLLGATPHGAVNHPREICGAENEDAVERVANALHLNEKLGLDPARRLALRV